MRFSEKSARMAVAVLLAFSMCVPGQLAFAQTGGASSFSVEPENTPSLDASASDVASGRGISGSMLTDEDIEEVLRGLSFGASDDSSAEADGSIAHEETSSSGESHLGMYSADSHGASAFSLPAPGSSNVVELAGNSQCDTSAAQALYAFSSSEYAIVASGKSAVDALSASALAGALNCPILLPMPDELSDSVGQALRSLGVRQAIVVGGTTVVPEDIVSAIEEITGTAPVRLAGNDLFDTQIDIYSYGKANGLWGDTAFVANGELSYADALSASPLAYSMKAPVFLANEDAQLPEKVAKALVGGGFTRIIAVGGTAVVSERTMGVLDAAVAASGGSYGNVLRLAGNSLYDTSVEVARWAVDEGLLSWDGAAFATGKYPYDALAGSAVQGKCKSVLLLIDEGNTETLDAIVESGAAVSSIKFFGGTAVVTPATRQQVTEALGLSRNAISFEDYAMTLDELTDIEYANTSKYHSYSRDEVQTKLDPANFSYGESSFYQFADLSQGYSGRTAEELDAFIDSRVTYSERNYGVTSKLRGAGAYFVEAAKTYNVNEVYLLAHAALESAWGCSALAQGTIVQKDGEGNIIKDYRGYYNFYGIGAYDADPLNGGAALAKQQGWSSVELAIMGAAKCLSNWYINPTVSSAKVSGDQNTLWKMRWDARAAEKTGSVSHEYATSITWATGIASIMGEFYKSQGYSFDRTGLKFIVPRFE